MHYKDSIGLRYPKGPFAMATVYSLAGSSILASTIFSLLLFLSIDDNVWMKVLFGSLAIIFEIGKFYAWYEYGERRAHQNYSGASSALIFYLVLAAISIGGSIGGINSATNQAQGHIAIAQAKVDAFNRQIDAIDKQIALNDEAAQKYIEMKLIAYGVNRIQVENKKLRDEQLKLAIERDSLPPVNEGSVIGLIESLAKVFGVATKQAQLALVIFLSILLDFFAAFFVAVIGEESRFRHYYQANKSLTIDAVTDSVSPITAVMLPLKDTDNADSYDNNDVDKDEDDGEKYQVSSIENEIVDAIKNSVVSCSKKAVTKYFKLHADEVDKIFNHLMSKGLIGKKANNHYHWIG